MIAIWIGNIISFVINLPDKTTKNAFPYKRESIKLMQGKSTIQSTKADDIANLISKDFPLKNSPSFLLCSNKP